MNAKQIKEQEAEASIARLSQACEFDYSPFTATTPALSDEDKRQLEAMLDAPPTIIIHGLDNDVVDEKVYD